MASSATQRRARYRVRMHPEALGTHQWSFFAGLAELHRRRIVDVEFVEVRNSPVRAGATTIVLDKENGAEVLIGWEMHDTPPLNDWHAHNADVVIKRSYDVGSTDQYRSARGRVLPMGLTLGCGANGLVGLAARSTARLSTGLFSDRSKGNLRTAAASWWTILKSATAPRVGLHPEVVQEDLRFLEALGETKATRPYVTFLVRAWDPASIHPDLSDDLDAVTRERAELIRVLRSELGNRFVGGFVPSDYVESAYPDCAAPVSTRRRDFLRRTAVGGIAVSTRGLSESNPWKLAEYAAMGVAIVSEPLAHLVPEPMTNNVHMASFTDADECLLHCRRLLGDPELRNTMQIASRSYWDENVRPDRLILRRIEEAFRASP